MKRLAVLTGAQNNCGDYLIRSRALGLFGRFLPGIGITEISRLKPYADEEIDAIRSADCVIVVGGPCVRNNSAKALHLTPLLAAGGMKAPIVILGGGAHHREPFGHGQLCPTPDTAVFFERIRRSPYVSGVRDFETLAMLKALGVGNVRFSGCPAMFPAAGEPKPEPDAPDGTLHKIVFSCGAPGGMSERMARQHLDVVERLSGRFPEARLVAAFHHTPDPEKFAASCGRPLPAGYTALHRTLCGLGIECADISGGVEPMLAMYRDADLHVGYRVHAHVLMKSWGKRSVLIAEDGRGSGMAEVVGGPVMRSWSNAPWLRKRAFRLFHLGDPKKYAPSLGQKAVEATSEASGASSNWRAEASNAMESWFAQFAR